MKRGDADPEVCKSHSSEINISESLSGFFEKSEEVEYHETGTDVDYYVARAPNVLADIDVKTTESIDHCPNQLTGIINYCISPFEKTGFQHSEDKNESEYINPDHSRWFRYHQNSTDQLVELCQLVPRVMQSYPIPRQKMKIGQWPVNSGTGASSKELFESR
ncbi:hypothetical protein BOTNAR_0193g00290 [Botryotinia narcissicola]|uniref:Uncharacterized protein n=1 Tax=Botryotinia narcissicola TaxID=278944 RepID=A0A4Z1IB26_9HELO|nr:hypothetical protein BOTNAR_0193g00290 [Botryotinia narcissicola]